jgi:hypothetical protein
MASRISAVNLAFAPICRGALAALARQGDRTAAGARLRIYCWTPLALETSQARIVAGTVVRNRLPHDDEAGRLKFGDQALGDHLRHSFGRLTPRQGATACERERKQISTSLRVAGVSCSSGMAGR